MCKRLEDHWGPNSQKDAEEIRRTLNNLQGDYRGWDIYLSALDELTEVLAKTPVRDTANNPIMEPVAVRPHLPHPPLHSTYAQTQAFFAADRAAQVAWDLTHPANITMNHRPTDPAIKNIVILALGQSGFQHYSALAQRYQQTDHATRTWPELRQDIESLVQNNNRGTSREPSSLPRQDRKRPHDDDWDRRSAHRRDTTQDNRSARNTAYNDDSAYGHHYKQHTGNRPTFQHQYHHDSTSLPQDVRAASQPTSSPSASPKFPCINCGGDHRPNVCDSTTCSLCQANFPTAAQRHAHYIAHHHRDNTPNKRARFDNNPSPYKKPQHTPPTSPFLNVRSARSGYSSNASQSSYDSGYDSTASGPGHPPNSDHEEEQTAAAIYDARVVTYTTQPTTSAVPDTLPQQQTTPQILPFSPLHPAHHAHITLQQHHHAPIHLDLTGPFSPNHYITPATIIDADARIQYGLSQAALRYTTRRTAYGHTTSTEQAPSMPRLIHQPTYTDDDNDDDDLPDLISPTDDELNAITRRNNNQHILPPTQPPHDIRVVRNNSDTEPNNSTSDDEEINPNYWTEVPGLTRLTLDPRMLLPPWDAPALPTRPEIARWSTLQVTWLAFIQTLPRAHQRAYAGRPAPILHRNEPNRQYMLDHDSNTPDVMYATARLNNYMQQLPRPTWTAYLDYINLPTARFYHHYPPMPDDNVTTLNLNPTPLTTSNQLPTSTSLKDPAQPHPDDVQRSSLTTNRNRTTTNVAPPGGYHRGRPPRLPSHLWPTPEDYPQLLPDEEDEEEEALTISEEIAREDAIQRQLDQAHASTRPRRSASPDLPPPRQRSSSSAQQDSARSERLTRLGGYPDASHASQPTLFTNRTYHAPDPHNRFSSYQSSSNDHFNNKHLTERQPPPAHKRSRTTISPTDHNNKHHKGPHHSSSEDDDTPGEPWCDCCTAQLSDIDQARAIHDRRNPSTRYRIRQPHHPPPSHSNQHRDYLRIFRENAEFHAKQRHYNDSHLARTGLAPHYTPTTSYNNSDSYATIPSTIRQLQYARYQSRGGHLPLGSHQQDFRFNSPNYLNMRPEQEYRQWFHNTVSRNHYSLGEATETYDQWLTHHTYGPNPTRTQQSLTNPPPPAPAQPTPNNNHRHHYLPSYHTPSHPTRPSHVPPPRSPIYSRLSDNDDSQATDSPVHDGYDDDDDQHDIRTQTYVESISTSPDDPNAVIDSGAMMTTVPRRLLLGTQWEDNIRPAPPGTTIRYGNMETEVVEESAQIGSYNTSLVPDRFSTALVCVHDIVAAGHSVTFTNLQCIITDNDGAYTITTPRTPSSREWRAPLHILQRLTDLRTANPSRHARPYPSHTETNN